MAHESFDRPDDVKLGSERSFGLVFAVVFGLIGGRAMWLERPWGVYALGAGAVFLVLAFALPIVLRPLNWIWFKFGLLLHKIMSPVILGLLFFGVIMPIGLLMWILGKRPLSLAFDKASSSYWTPRTPPGPAPDTFSKQF